MGFAQISIVGNIGRDPEMRYTPQGKPVTNMNVAVSHARPDGNGGWTDESTDWFRIAVWGDRAERVADQFRKGDRVLVHGRFKSREFERRDGGTGTSLEIDATEVIPAFRTKGGADEEGSGGFGQAGVQPPATVPAGAGAGTRTPAHDDLDDLPF